MLRKALTVLLVVVLCASGVMPAYAQDPEPPPPPPPLDPVTQIFQYLIQFPTDSLVEALTQALQAILTNSITPLEQVFSASLARWVTTSPGILTPGGGIVDGVDVMLPTWNLTSRIAILLWPLTLAITAVVAAKDVITAGRWGIGDLKQAFGTWLFAVIASASSLYWMDLANRFANATTDAILNLSFFGASGFDPNLLTSILIGSAVMVLGMTGLGLIVAIIILVIGISILASLIFQFLARYALLYVLVALAPIVIMLGVLPPMRWFTLTWLRGFVMVLVIGPINALLMKLVILLGARGLSSDPITAFVNFMAAAGVLSALLAINYTLIRFVFGAFGQVLERAVGTVTAVGTLALAAVGGVAAAGAVGAASGSAASSSRGLGVGLQTAGSMMARSGGIGRGVGGALWGIGNALRESERGTSSPNGAATSRHVDHSRGTSTGQQSNQVTTAPANTSAHSTPPVPVADAEVQGNPSTSVNPGEAQSRRSANNGSRTANSTPHSSNRTSALPNLPVHDPSQIEGDDFRPLSNFIPIVTQDQPSTETGDNETTPPHVAELEDNTSQPAVQTSNRSFSSRAPEDSIPKLPTGPLTATQASTTSTPNAVSPNLATLTNARSSNLVGVTPQAQSLIKLLDAPLGERVRALTEQYASPAEQMTAAQGAVASLSAIEAHHNVEPQLLAASWDQTMGPILTSAREGMSLETMANDAGYQGDVTQFIGARVEGGLLAVHPSSREALFPRADSPAVNPWHPQIGPHDVEVGQQLTTMLGTPTQDTLSFAHIYHSLRSPESGGGWNVGMGLREAAQQVTTLEPARRLGALDSRLHSLEKQGMVSPNGMRLWRVYLARSQNQKG
ncbi:MAG: hypothetical protein IT331_13515 [Anaerolineae bacterium]|nr:hypothetical protein [Anaerolineae bacterium]